MAKSHLYSAYTVRYILYKYLYIWCSTHENGPLCNLRTTQAKINLCIRAVCLGMTAKSRCVAAQTCLGIRHKCLFVGWRPVICYRDFQVKYYRCKYRKISFKGNKYTLMGEATPSELFCLPYEKGPTRKVFYRRPLYIRGFLCRKAHMKSKQNYLSCMKWRIVY